MAPTPQPDMAAPARDPAPLILVVDDEPLVLQLMVRTLQDAGYTVHGARGALQALDLFARFPAPPAALVTDIRMDPIDGAGLAKVVLQQCPGLPVLFVSGYGPGDQYGNLPGPLLKKPFLADQLVDAVAGLIARPRATQSSA
jgi:two-component system, cell cycle sensor histidine kinase and response regulator CckA